jgi:hypothetical protein
VADLIEFLGLGFEMRNGGNFELDGFFKKMIWLAYKIVFRFVLNCLKLKRHERVRKWDRFFSVINIIITVLVS